MNDSPTTQHVSLLYRFLAQSMQYPDSSWLTEQYLETLNHLLESLGGDTEKQQLSDAVAIDEKTLEDLQIEYTRLFINGVPHVVAPPYGSVYLEKTLRGKYSERIVQFYNEHGFVLTQQSDLPDSVIHQLEFLSLITEEGDKETERNFLEKYFLVWYPAFSELVRNNTTHPFYLIILTLIDFFTKEEQ